MRGRRIHIDDSPRPRTRCVLCATAIVLILATGVAIYGFPVVERPLAAKGSPPRGPRLHALRDAATVEGAGAVCKYNSVGHLHALIVRSPSVRAQRPLPVDPATHLRYLQQWVGWRPMLQKRFDDVKRAARGDRAEVKADQQGWTSFRPDRGRILASTQGIFRALVRAMWFDPRPSYRNVVRARVTERVIHHFDPAWGRARRQCSGPVSVLWTTTSRGRRDIAAPLPVGATGEGLLAASDFDGNQVDDVYAYRAAGSDELLWGDGRYLSEREDSNADMRLDRLPLAGDFDRDGIADLFWYGAGVQSSDEIWWGTKRGDFEVTDESVRGDYRPAVGDFDGDSTSDILWYSSEGTTERDSVWWGNESRNFVLTGATARQVDGSFRPIVGNFDGDCCDDVLWSPGGAGDEEPIWFGRPDRSFIVDESWGSMPPVTPYHVVVAGNFDGDCCDDLFLFSRISDEDVQWGSTEHGFVRSTASNRVPPHPKLGHATPISGNFLGRPARQEILWVRSDK